MPKVDVIPAIATSDIDSLGAQIKLVESYVEWVQLDVMDGIFVPNKTWNNPAELNQIKTTALLEAHLMIKDPEPFIDDWLKAGVKRIILHYESAGDLGMVLNKIAGAGMKAGLAINPETPVDVLYPFLNELDLVLVMTVRPGSSGQKFLDGTLAKISALRAKNSEINIEVDGGINFETAPRVMAAGANLLACTSIIFKSDDIASTIKKLKNN